jgi:hypothetical protein
MMKVAADSREASPRHGTRSTSNYALEGEPTQGEGLDTDNEEDDRDKRSGMFWRRRSSSSVAAGNTCTEDFG